MDIIKNIPLLRKYINEKRQEGKFISLVPTMGNLHNGHMRLIDESSKYSDIVVVSIFVNPLQFNCHNDLIRYPRTLHEDLEKLKNIKVNMIFIPELTEIYPYGISNQTIVNVPRISTILEGARRPAHFNGVSTIISKLFNLVQPNFAFFGEKDYQQLILIKKMVIDMGYDIKIISIPTVRDKDGLALSSRNSHLTPSERKIAPQISEIMNSLADSLTNDNKPLSMLLNQTVDKLRDAGFTPDGVFIRDAFTLKKITKNSERAVILISVWLGQTRLIDNRQVNLIK